MGTIPFPRNQRRLSLRYYLFDGEVIWRVPHRLYRALLSGEAVLPQYANSKQKGVEVLVWTNPRTARDIETRGTLFSFDSKGSIDLADAAEAAAIAIEGSQPRPLDKNVLDIRPVIRTRQLSREKGWTISTVVLRAIIADINGDRRLPALKSDSF
jgi:hypothetical protein